MQLHSITRPPLTVMAPPGWEDVTDHVGEENVPFTLGKPGGQGALQLAPGVQQQAGKSAPTPADLLTMCEEIALQKGLRHGVEPRAELGVPLMAGLSFHAEGTFIRIWVVFDGRHFVAASYICALGAEALELGEAEVIVRSVVWR